MHELSQSYERSLYSHGRIPYIVLKATLKWQSRSISRHCFFLI
uniref:Ubiquitin-conjugating enzyme E2-22 kDa n=1 Tax=Arundo donax TaxID=35708 RepID=A0A0A9G0C8_ARUDO